jgi:hypothetical protein
VRADVAAVVRPAPRRRPFGVGVGEQHRGPGRVDLVEGVDEQRQVVPAQVVDGGEDLVVGEGVEQPADPDPGDARAGEHPPQLGPSGVPQHRGLRGVHRDQSLPQRLPAGPPEEFGEPAAVTQGENLPAGRLEDAGRAGRAARSRRRAGGSGPRDGDDPQQLPEVGGPFVGDGLPHRGVP